MSPSNRLVRASVSARRRFGSRSDGAKFLLILLKVITIFSPLRIFAPISALAFAVGAIYGAWNFVYHARIPNGAVLVLMFSVIVLLVGLVSEQITTLRFEGRHDEDAGPDSDLQREGQPADPGRGSDDDSRRAR